MRPKRFDTETARVLLHRADWPSLDMRDVVSRLIDAVDILQQRLDVGGVVPITDEEPHPHAPADDGVIAAARRWRREER